MGTFKRGAFSHSPRHSAIVAPLRDIALWNRHLLASDTGRVPQFWLAYSFRGSRKSYTDREIHGFYSSEERNQPPSCPSERVLLSNRKYGRHKCVRCSESHLVPWHHPRYSYEIPDPLLGDPIRFSDSRPADGSPIIVPIAQQSQR